MLKVGNKMRRIYEYINDDIEFLKSQTYFHGTSTSIKIKNGILKPSTTTNVVREQLLNQVYIITSLGSARRYAYKAVNRFGGEPVVYEVKPDLDTLVNRIDCEYVCDFAEIVKEI